MQKTKRMPRSEAQARLRARTARMQQEIELMNNARDTREQWPWYLKLTTAGMFPMDNVSEDARTTKEFTRHPVRTALLFSFVGFLILCILYGVLSLALFLTKL